MNEGFLAYLLTSKGFTPWKIKMEHKNAGGWFRCFFLFKGGVIFNSSRRSFSGGVSKIASIKTLRRPGKKRPDSFSGWRTRGLAMGSIRFFSPAGWDQTLFPTRFNSWPVWFPMVEGHCFLNCHLKTSKLPPENRWHSMFFLGIFFFTHFVFFVYNYIYKMGPKYQLQVGL